MRSTYHQPKQVLKRKLAAEMMAKCRERDLSYCRVTKELRTSTGVIVPMREIVWYAPPDAFLEHTRYADMQRLLARELKHQLMPRIE